MNSLSRHIACKLCRERKVRCDGCQPACEKCRRSGETCVYVPTHKPTKADLAQTIESLQERLDKAEAYISKHNTSDKGRTGDASIGTPNSSIGVDFTDCTSFNLQMPSSGGPGDEFLSMGIPDVSSDSYTHHTFPLSPDHMDNDFLNYLPSPHTDTSRFLVEESRQMEDIAGSGSITSFRQESFYGCKQLPSLREIRALNSSTSTTPPPCSPNGRVHRGEDANKILAEFTSFGMAVFHTQAEIAGIASIVAEYLEWMRKTPASASACDQGQGGGGGPKASAAVLETLEARVQELQSLASTRHAEAWRQSVAMLEKIEGMGAMLSLFDNEIQRRRADTAEFFHTSYDVCTPLAEQQLSRKDQHASYSDGG
ncbi:hypothetical protein F5Y15DRAFT_425397 [Xylariaceae sp. FL0016]|nr:hypothetical protein F5Y15DRAFT_425397 [Xylariaceae sp. FL0016]